MAQKPKSSKSKKSLTHGVTTTTQSLTLSLADNAYLRAEQAFKAGQHAQAEQLCQQILATTPHHALTLHLLGVIMAHAGQLQNAEQLMVQALQFRPDDANFHNSLANVRRLLNRPANKTASPRIEYVNLTNMLDSFLPEPFLPTLVVDTPIDIIVPIYNGYDYLVTLLPAILKHTTLPYRLLCCNDASPDPRVADYLEEIHRTHPQVILLHNDHNLGFVGTVNRAYQQVQNHFVILNQDTEVPEGWLERLMYPIFKYHDVASTTPFTNSGTICSFPTWLEDNPLFKGLTVTGLDKFFQRLNPMLHYFELPTGVGFCMGINKRVADTIGMFDADTFGRGYGEENDWCMRAKQAGYKNFIVPNLFVYHKHGGSFSAAERTQLQQENLAKLFRLHPEYSALVNTFINRNPLKTIREFLVILISTHTHSQGAVLVIDHELGGGANLFSQKFKQEWVNQGRPVLSLSYHRSKEVYRLSYQDPHYQFGYVFPEIVGLYHLFALLNITDLRINELVSFKASLETVSFLTDLKRRFQPQMTVYLHDYFAICPSYNLLNDQGKYCGIPEDLQICQRCLKVHKRLDFPELYNPLDWRNGWGQLLNLANQIVCFSPSSKSLLKQAYPALPETQIEVCPHRVEYLQPLNFTPTPGTLHIGVLGAIGFHKGISILTEMVKLIERKKYDAKIIVIGYTGGSFTSNKLVVTGEYTHEELPALIVQHNISMFFIPSICPETFSFTTEEVMMMGLPLAVFNLGAPAERVKGYEKGLVIEKIAAEYALLELLKFGEKLRS